MEVAGYESRYTEMNIEMEYPSEESLNLVTCRKFRFKVRRIRNGSEENPRPKLSRFENNFSKCMEAQLVNGVRKIRGLNDNNPSDFITSQQMAKPMGYNLGHVL